MPREQLQEVPEYSNAPEASSDVPDGGQLVRQCEREQFSTLGTASCRERDKLPSFVLVGHGDAAGRPRQHPFPKDLAIRLIEGP